MAKPITRIFLLFVVCFLALQKIAFSADQRLLNKQKRKANWSFIRVSLKPKRARSLPVLNRNILL